MIFIQEGFIFFYFVYCCVNQEEMGCEEYRRQLALGLS